jgi:two-component system, cell cycle response regulator
MGFLRSVWASGGNSSTGLSGFSVWSKPLKTEPAMLESLLARTLDETREEVIQEASGPHLMVLHGPNLGVFFKLDGGETVLGADPLRADVPLGDTKVAPAHARVYGFPGGGFHVEPLDAPVYLNGEAMMTPRPVRDGDRLQLGDTVLEFADPDPLKARFNDVLRRALDHDHLTGLLAKPRFDERFEQVLEVHREVGDPLSVIMADVDNLKKINDAHGHHLGEFVVAQVGRLIGKAHEESGRQATRFGGDEYQTVLPETDRAHAILVAENLRHSVETHAFRQRGVEVEPTVSLGVAAFPQDGATTGSLTRAADEALYRAKDAGGNIVCV